MIKKTMLTAAISLFVLTLSVPVTAHHSAAAQFDTTQEFVLTGVLTELQEINPHSIWHIDVKDADGRIAPVEGRKPVDADHERTRRRHGGPGAPGAQDFSKKTFWAARTLAPKATGRPKAARTCSSADSAMITSTSVA